MDEGSHPQEADRLSVPARLTVIPTHDPHSGWTENRGPVRAAGGSGRMTGSGSQRPCWYLRS